MAAPCGASPIGSWRSPAPCSRPERSIIRGNSARSGTSQKPLDHWWGVPPLRSRRRRRREGQGVAAHPQTLSLEACRLARSRSRRRAGIQPACISALLLLLLANSHCVRRLDPGRRRERVSPTRCHLLPKPDLSAESAPPSFRATPATPNTRARKSLYQQYADPTLSQPCEYFSHPPRRRAVVQPFNGARWTHGA